MKALEGAPEALLTEIRWAVGIAIDETAIWMSGETEEEYQARALDQQERLERLYAKLEKAVTMNDIWIGKPGSTAIDRWHEQNPGVIRSIERTGRIYAVKLHNGLAFSVETAGSTLDILNSLTSKGA